MNIATFYILPHHAQHLIGSCVQHNVCEGEFSYSAFEKVSSVYDGECVHIAFKRSSGSCVHLSVYDGECVYMRLVEC